ncbi:hypothetical protein A9Q81_10340 [Gammaproteobacteria bacterium 42_54_T18]|nr:hypothetical protein A9Q81_10340 [Gammaproteobacteria bacterium 42_54_T18]
MLVNKVNTVAIFLQGESAEKLRVTTPPKHRIVQLVSHNLGKNIVVALFEDLPVSSQTSHLT